MKISVRYSRVRLALTNGRQAVESRTDTLIGLESFPDIWNHTPVMCDDMYSDRLTCTLTTKKKLTGLAGTSSGTASNINNSKIPLRLY